MMESASQTAYFAYAGPAGGVDFEQETLDFIASVAADARRKCGDDISIRLMPYRYDADTEYLGLDMRGNHGELSMTFTIGAGNSLRSSEQDIWVMDGTDALLIAFAITKILRGKLELSHRF